MLQICFICLQVWSLVLQNCKLNEVLVATCPLVSSWLYLITTPPSTPLDQSLLLSSTNPQDGVKSSLFLGGVLPQDHSQAFMCRFYAAKLLGKLSLYVTRPMEGVEYSSTEAPVACYARLLLSHLRTQSAYQRLAAALVMREWALQFTQQHAGKSGDCLYLALNCETKESPPLQELMGALLDCLTQPVYFDEIAVSFTRLQQETRDFLSTLKHYHVEVEDSYLNAPVLTLDQVSQSIYSEALLEQLNSNKVRNKVRSTLDERRRSIIGLLTSTTKSQETLSTMTRSAVAGALVRLGAIPPKVNPVVKSLIDAIKTLEVERMQNCAGQDLSLLLELCIPRAKNPNAKIVKNVSSYLCADPKNTPHIALQNSLRDKCSAIYFLKSFDEQQNTTPPTAKTESTSADTPTPEQPVKRKRGRPPTKPREVIVDNNGSGAPKVTSVQRRGCLNALQCIVRHFGERIPAVLPSMWEYVLSHLKHSDQVPEKSPVGASNGSDKAVHLQDGEDGDALAVVNCDLEDGDAQAVVNWLQLLEAIVPILPPPLLSTVCSHLKCVERFLHHKYAGVRHMAARVVGALVTVCPSEVMLFVLNSVLPALKDIESVAKRQGAVECLHMVVESLHLRVLPYIVLLIVPLLRSSSDSDECVRAAGKTNITTIKVHFRHFSIVSKFLELILSLPGLRPSPVLLKWIQRSICLYSIYCICKEKNVLQPDPNLFCIPVIPGCIKRSTANS